MTVRGWALGVTTGPDSSATAGSARLSQADIGTMASIRVDSPGQGQGTTFSVSLPVASSDTEHTELALRR